MAPSPPSVGATATGGGAVRALWPDGDDIIVPSLATDLRKPGDETPMAAGGPPKQLFTVLREAAADGDAQLTAVFASDHVYVLPGAGPGSTGGRARAEVVELM